MAEKNLFYGSLMDLLDSNDPLIALADTIEWSKLEADLQKYYTGIGRPPKSIRLMVGLLLLKQLENLSDENIVLQWKRNPYYQYFCGFTDYTAGLPCHPTELVKFRDRIGKEGMEAIFSMSVSLHGDKAEELEAIVDTTVQESNLTYPTDGKLAIKIIIHLLRIAKKEGIKLRRSYIKEIKALRILLQEKNTPHKIYSLHETDAYAINKGKDHKGYEYGTKASIVITKQSCIIISVAAHKENIHDSKTLDEAIGNAHKNRSTPIKEAICDRGYRGVKEVSNITIVDTAIVLILLLVQIIKPHLDLFGHFRVYTDQLTIAYCTTISIPGNVLKRDTKEEREIKREKFRRRAAVEPVIGHLKSDHRMARNYLKGFVGDERNLLLAATVFNLKKWMRIYFLVLFLYFIRVTLVLLRQTRGTSQHEEWMIVRKIYLMPPSGG